MPTVLTHLAVPLAARVATGRATISNRLLVAGALGSVLPDLDAIGFFAGVPYESLLGHRGLTHSLSFALLLACCALALADRLRARRGWAFAFLFLGSASHGVLDALTDGGLGVAFLSPFSNQRFFCPWRPIPVSPIGVDGLLSPYGVRLFAAEVALVWLPCLLVALSVRAARRLRRGGTGGGPMRMDRDRPGAKPRFRPSVLAGAVLAVTCGLVGAYRIGAWPFHRTQSADDGRSSQNEAIANLERQVEKLAARDGSACPQDFSALDGDPGDPSDPGNPGDPGDQTARPMRISLFHGYDDHEGKVYDRVNSGALLHVLTGACRGHLSACEFSIESRSDSAATLARTIRGRRVEINLFTSSLPEGDRERRGAAAASVEQERLSRSAKESFYRELVESDVVFYMGHSRLGGGMGFDHQTGATTLVNAVLRLPMAPVLDALRRRPTRLRILGMFSCESERYFRRAIEEANPSLSLILTTGELRYAPGEQTSLGALEAVLSRYCGYAFHDSMIAASEPDPEMTRLYRGR